MTQQESSESIRHMKEVTDAIFDISNTLQTASDRSYILISRDQYSLSFMAEKLREEVIKPLEEVLARAKNLEDRIVLVDNPYFKYLEAK